MAVSNKIKTMLTLTGKTHAELASHLGISPQALSNKFYRDSFSASDLIKIAEFCKGTLSFQTTNGSVVFESSDIK